MIKRKKLIVYSLPLDCWCHIIEFIDSREDFISVVSSVKCLLDYICRIFPKCTSNILFKSLYLPDTPQHHVSFLYMKICKESKFLENTLSTIRRTNFVGFFRKLVSCFKNVEKLHLHLWNEIENNSLIHWNFNFLKMCSCESNLSSLVYIDLLVTESNLYIDQQFPCLKNMVLREYRRLSEPHKKLRINFSKIPRLNNLCIFGFEMESSFEPISQSIERFVFGGVLKNEKEGNIINFKKLKFLQIESHGVGSIRKIGNLENLQSLGIFNFCRFIQLLTGYNFPTGPLPKVTLELKFENFRNLKRFSLGVYNSQLFKKSKTVSAYEVEIEHLGTIVLKNLPNLTHVKVKNSHIPVMIDNCPKFERLFVQESEKVDTMRFSDLSNIRYLTLCNAFLDTTMIMNNLEKLSNLTKLHMFGIKDDFYTHRQPSIKSFSKNIEKFYAPQTTIVSFKEFGDCPKLKCLGICTFPAIKLWNLPVLEHLDLAFPIQDNIIEEGFWKEIGNIQRDGLTVVLCGAKFDKCPFPVEHVGKIKRIEAFCCDTFDYDGKNESHIELIIANVSNGVYVKNHPELSELNVGRYRMNDVEVMEFDFHVENCQSLKKLGLRFIFALEKFEVNRFKLYNTPVEVLEISLGDRKLGREDVHFEVNETMFPSLKKVIFSVMRQTNQNENEKKNLCRVSSFVNLKNLEKIEIRLIRGDIEEGDIFCKKFVGINYERIEVDYKEKTYSLEDFFKNVLGKNLMDYLEF